MNTHIKVGQFGSNPCYYCWNTELFLQGTAFYWCTP